MHIDQLLEHAGNAETSALQIPETWAQGRTAFGGLSAAMVYAAIKQKVDSDRVMRSFNCNFIGPVEPNKDFHIDVEVLRAGKSATQVLGKIVQEGKVSVLCQVCFGVDRKSKIHIENRDTHQMEAPTKGKFIPQIPKVTPKFLRYVDLSIDSGKVPFTGSKHSHIHGWMRFKQAPEVFSDAHIIALIDAWPPTVLQMLRWPAPASSMNWNVEFIHPHSLMQPDEWLAYQVKTRQAAAGYAHTEANIWDAKGELIALSRQTVGVFD